WLEVSKAMMGIALAVEFVVILFSLLALLVSVTKLMAISTAAGALFSSILGLVGVAVFQIEARKLFRKLTLDKPEEPAWSFYVFLTGQLMYVLCGLGHLVDSRGRGR
ncbi:hypothetical protein ElyMa_004447000, partial [Elysia marginata]